MAGRVCGVLPGCVGRSVRMRGAAVPVVAGSAARAVHGVVSAVKDEQKENRTPGGG